MGAAESSGRRPYMEDRSVVIRDLQQACSRQGEDDATSAAPLSYLGVFDGHNGDCAASIASLRLHQHLMDGLRMRAGGPGAGSNSLCSVSNPSHASASHPASSPSRATLRAAMLHAFRATEREIMGSARAVQTTGATATCAVLAGTRLVVGHLGDCRAVLGRRSEPAPTEDAPNQVPGEHSLHSARPLTMDHKPWMPDEKARTLAAGGRIEFAAGWRIISQPTDGHPATGLAVSRAFGDVSFKTPLPVVNSEPDIVDAELTQDDEFLVIASDGLWDVVSNQDACALVSRALQTHSGATAAHAAKAAAAALVSAALKNGSFDNVTAVVAVFPWKLPRI